MLNFIHSWCCFISSLSASTTLNLGKLFQPTREWYEKNAVSWSVVPLASCS